MLIKAIFISKFVHRHTYLARHFSDVTCFQNKLNSTKVERFSSKQVRDLFLKYFIRDKNHTYIQSSPVFLNNDPSLLFVNAGMNQFRSVLLNNTYPGHVFHGLKRAANSQKCIRLSGKHNDLEEVGSDVYHHTFFEMLGNWSFGDYSKVEACEMAWELLTSVYGLNTDNLYVTYFGGDKHLKLPSDEETKEIWLQIGIHANHIFPFGAKDNFWEMADKGPCGPCTEIHYDFSNSGPQAVSRKINTGSPDVMEIWNLVFIQYNKELNGKLVDLPLNVDTGMGLERLVAVLQGTTSTYDTDLFSSIFQTISKNFKVRPYTGKTGSEDIDGIDRAYRILADHSRMFCVAIADGLFPDTYDAGHILRKIIRRAVYTANCSMKTQPGALSTLVPCVAQSLDFFPEVQQHVDEITYIINDEEKIYHKLINKGRKARNRMNADNPGSNLTGRQVFELHKIHGLELNVVQDLASEKNLHIDWEDYEKVKNAEIQLSSKEVSEKRDTTNMAKSLVEQNVPLTDDSFKYKYKTDYNNHGVEDITAKITAIFCNKKLSLDVEKGKECMLVTNKSNFYSEGGGQVSDIGIIFNDDFTFTVKQVSSSLGYVFHQGIVTEGHVTCHRDVNMNVDKEHRLSCSQNHTATHIVNAALRKVLPYTVQRSSLVCSDYLRFGFSAKSQLSPNQLGEIEKYANQIIVKELKVSRKEMKYDKLLDHPNVILLRGENYPNIVSVIVIGEESSTEFPYVEPCCGTHVQNTADMETFVLVPTKSHGGSTKYLSAATGKRAHQVLSNGKALENRVRELELKVNSILRNFVPVENSTSSCLDLQKEINKTLKECQSRYDVPLIVVNRLEEILKDLKQRTNDVVNSWSKVDESGNSECDSNQKRNFNLQIVSDCLKTKRIPPTEDAFKYDYSESGVNKISAKILAVVKDNEILDSVGRGLNCQVILDKTNFYSENDNQVSDEGTLSCEDFSVDINNVYEKEGYVIHDGYVQEGNIVTGNSVDLYINQEHRLASSRNHTALHLLNSALKNKLSYFHPNSAIVKPTELELVLTAKDVITDDQLREIETIVNKSIQANLKVEKSVKELNSLEDIPPYKSALIAECKKFVPVVTIGEKNQEDLLYSTEPCFGTHVSSTEDIGTFIIIACKLNKNKDRVIRAVTGNQAIIVQKDGEEYHRKLTETEECVLDCLEKPEPDMLELWDCLKKVKKAKNYHETELPLLLFRSHQHKLTSLTKMLEEATDSFVQKGFVQVKAEMEMILKDNSDKEFIVHELSTLGDGKKVINYAIQNSNDKPVLYFAKDGNESIICSCSVPKNLVNECLSALLWMNPVASYLEGEARTLVKDPELSFSVVSKRTDKVERAKLIAEEFISKNLGKCS